MGILSESVLKDIVDDNFKKLSRGKQVEIFLKALYDAGNKIITLKDISEIFKDANMRSLEHQKKIRCGAFKVKELFDIMTRKNPDRECCIVMKELSDDQYEITMRKNIKN